MDEESEFCACGCGQSLPPRPRFLRNHQHRQWGHTVEDRGYETPCWIALKKPNTNGYVVFKWTIDGRDTRIGAHRLAYIRAFGPVPRGLHVHHKCDVPVCVNPDHLEVLTPAENIRKQGQTKLSPDLVRMIRTSDLSNRELADQLGVTSSLIWAVRAGRLWADVE